MHRDMTLAEGGVILVWLCTGIEAIELLSDRGGIPVVPFVPVAFTEPPLSWLYESAYFSRSALSCSLGI